ncbi:hypothetical protein ACFL0M_12235 [Thermodesulfobacteriota bacterium]
MEKRPPAEGNRVQMAVTGPQGLEAASIGLNRVRETAKRDKDLRITNLLHLTRSNFSASDLRQEPSAIVPHAWDLGSSRQGCNPAGESPAMPIARFRHVAIPQFMWVTTCPLRGVNGPAALKTQSFSGGCNLGA